MKSKQKMMDCNISDFALQSVCDPTSNDTQVGRGTGVGSLWVKIGVQICDLIDTIGIFICLFLFLNSIAFISKFYVFYL